MSVIPDELHDLIVDIKFYSSVTKNKKICFSTRTMVASYGFMSSAYRSWNGEGKERLIEETKTLVERITASLKKDEFKEHSYLIYAAIPDLLRAIGLQVGVYNQYIDVVTNLGLYRTSLEKIYSNISEEDKIRVEEYNSQIHPSSSSSPSKFVVVSPIPRKVEYNSVSDIEHSDNCTCISNPDGFHTSSTPINIVKK